MPKSRSSTSKHYVGKRFWCYCQNCKGTKHVSRSAKRRHVAADERDLMNARTPEGRNMVMAALRANQWKNERVEPRQDATFGGADVVNEDDIEQQAQPRLDAAQDASDSAQSKLNGPLLEQGNDSADSEPSVKQNTVDRGRASPKHENFDPYSKGEDHDA